MTEHPLTHESGPAEPDRRRDQSHLVWGIVLIALGALMLVDQLQISTAPWGIRLNVGRLWPLILVVIGVARLVTSFGSERPLRGLWLILLGGLFLLHTYDVMHLSESWPLFIVAAGVSIMFGDRGRGRRC